MLNTVSIVGVHVATVSFHFTPFLNLTHHVKCCLFSPVNHSRTLNCKTMCDLVFNSAVIGCWMHCNKSFCIRQISHYRDVIFPEKHSAGTVDQLVEQLSMNRWACNLSLNCSWKHVETDTRMHIDVG